MKPVIFSRTLSSIRTFINAIALPAIVLALSATSALAQQGRGTILGTVTDPAGAAIAGARVTITNTSTNLVFNAVTGDEGFTPFPT
jgi:hypothetical protein